STTSAWRAGRVWTPRRHTLVAAAPGTRSRYRNRPASQGWHSAERGKPAALCRQRAAPRADRGPRDSDRVLARGLPCSRKWPLGAVRKPSLGGKKLIRETVSRAILLVLILLLVPATHASAPPGP